MNAALILFPRNAAQLELIMKTGLPPDACRILPDAMEPGFHCVSTWCFAVSGFVVLVGPGGLP